MAASGEGPRRSPRDDKEKVLFTRPHQDFATEGTPLLSPAPAAEKSWKKVRRLSMGAQEGDEEAGDASRKSASSPFKRAAQAAFFVETLEDEAERNETHYEVPTSRDLTLTQIIMSLGYVGYTMTAWVFCCFQRKHLFPRCGDVFPGPEQALIAHACAASQFFFWSFPIFCSLCVMVLFYRDLIHMRIWNDFLAHRVLVDFPNKAFLAHAKVRLILVWLMLGATMYLLRGPEKMTLTAFKMTLPYWFPVLSSLGLLYTNWDLETRLLSLAKFVEEDPAWSKHYHNQCYFIRDHIAAAAFKRVQERLDKHASEEAPAEGSVANGQRHRPTTGGMIMLILEEASRMHDRGEEVEDTERGYFDAFDNKYWANVFLSSEYLDDERARRFLLWFRFYMVYTILVVLTLTYFLLATFFSHLLHQRLIDENVVTRAVSSKWLDEVEQQVTFFQTFFHLFKF